MSTTIFVHLIEASEKRRAEFTEVRRNVAHGPIRLRSMAPAKVQIPTFSTTSYIPHDLAYLENAGAHSVDCRS